MDSNPDGQDLERIAQITGLSKRVTQVSAIRVVLQQKLHHPISSHIVYSTILKICFCSWYNVHNVTSWSPAGSDKCTRSLKIMHLHARLRTNSYSMQFSSLWQVWFQNTRARQKKHQQCNTSKHNSLNNMTSLANMNNSTPPLNVTVSSSYHHMGLTTPSSPDDSECYDHSEHVTPNDSECCKC